MMKRISVIGHFAYGKTFLDGQTIKTKIVTEELKRQVGNNQVLEIDTYGGIKNLWKAPFQIFKAFRQSKNIIIFPAQNGLRIYAPLLSFLKCFYKDRKLHYVVIGGWLPQFLSKRKALAKALKGFNHIYAETNMVKNTLEAQGFCNVTIMPNCKRLKILSKEELQYQGNMPYKLCTFSRVMKQKGIETAVDVIRRVNNQLGYTAYSLDIYGAVSEESREWFDALQLRFPDYVRYCGCVDADQSVEVLQSYFALLFPTHFYTEGIPGTIIDAYAAGIPVISAKWESFADVVEDRKTGIGYEFDHGEQLQEILLHVVKNPETVFLMKGNCIKKAKKYIPEATVRIITERLVW